MLDFAPIIQFVAAIYFSMCFEQVLERFFWGKKYLLKVERLTANVQQKFELTESDVACINSKFERRLVSFNNFASTLSIIFLLLSLAVLFYIGVEQISPRKLCVGYCMIVVVVLMVPMVYLFIAGYFHTQYFIKKMGRIIDEKGGEYSKTINAIISGDSDNKNYQEMLAKVVSLKDSDLGSKSQLIDDVSQEFKNVFVRDFIGTVETYKLCHFEKKCK